MSDLYTREEVDALISELREEIYREIFCNLTLSRTVYSDRVAVQLQFNNNVISEIQIDID